MDVGSGCMWEKEVQGFPNILYYVMLCYVMLLLDMLCHVMLRML
jgi:hypothetical protein